MSRDAGGIRTRTGVRNAPFRLPCARPCARPCGQSRARRVLLALVLLGLVAIPVGARAATEGPESEPDPNVPRKTFDDSPASPSDPSYLRQLLQRADELDLHEDPYWHTLLHYKRGLFGLRSLVDDPKYFASSQGKKKPEEELRATLRGFFSPFDSTEIKHAVCRFPARLAWLTDELAIDHSQLPVPSCDAFEDFYQSISPQSASLIFPTSHMNSPASMYGHTLLTVQGTTGSELLSYAINYSAITTATFGPLYILKGLLGLYPGYFSILPYYAKLQQYSDVNDRDIWEYPLDLDAAEIRRMLAHVYELENIYANYYFFSENCSYDLLFLLDAARPSLDLTDQFGWWVIPLDTIRTVKQFGLATDAIYRPSKSTKVTFLADGLSKEQRNLVIDVVRGKRKADELAEPSADNESSTSNRNLSRDERIRMADLASEYLQYVYAKGQVSREEYVPRFLATLGVRSALGVGEEWRYDIPAPARPDYGHRSSRLVVAGGVRDQTAFQELRLRAAYHDLLDAERGFKPGSEIVFLETSLRYYPKPDHFELERLDAIRITSIAPRTQFFKHTSWKVETGLLRRTRDTGRRVLVYGLNTGFGWAYGGILGLPHAMIETEAQVGGGLEHNYSLGVGASVGTVGNLIDGWRVQLVARAIFYRLGDEDDRYSVMLGQGIRLSTNWNLSIIGERITEHDVSIWDAKAGLRFFF